MPAKWTTAKIKLGPTGEFHMPHRCACCCIEYGLEQTELKGLWVEDPQHGKQDRIDIPVWYCIPCRKHIARNAFLRRAALWLSGLATASVLFWTTFAPNSGADWLRGQIQDNTALLVLLLAFVAVFVYSLVLFSAKLVLRRPSPECGTGQVAAFIHRANAASRAGVLKNGFVLKLSNHEYARLLDALNRSAGAHVELV